MKRDRNLVKLENSAIIALYIGEIIKSIESIFLFLFFFIKYLEKKKFQAISFKKRNGYS